MYRYSTLIVCKRCGMSFKAKKERKKVKYICSGYDRFGKDYCSRAIIKEDLLDEMLEHKFQKHIEDSEVRDQIDRIYIEGKFFEIFYKDGTTQLVQSNMIKFL